MPETTPATVQGPIGKVPCAHCGQPMDLTELIEDIGRGTSITCDHCEKNSEVVDIRKVIVVRQA
jgi:NAD-dependent SIR2 family protein deacetylase